MFDEILKPRHGDYLDFVRCKMVQHQVEGRGVRDRGVLDALCRVKRHQFLPESLTSRAYEDHPLPIDCGQTVSQPYIVGLMAEALAIGKGDKVLEIGAGSGYAAAVMAEMGAAVFAVEWHEPLFKEASERLARLGYKVRLKLGDGRGGWPEHAPYDAISAACAPLELPPALPEQLKEGGRLVIPLGPAGAQTLKLFVKKGGRLESRDLCAVSFVPMLGGEK